jgi:GT2 family glycosyltransferase
MIYVIIPNWNGLDFLAECLDSLALQTQDHQTVVVDNGSTDGSKELVRSKYPQVHLIELNRNTGFAGGVNRGIEYVLEQEADLIALFNNDAVANPDWLAELVKAGKAHPKAGIITSKIKHYEGSKLDSTGDFYSVWGLPFPRGRDEVDHGQYDDQREVFAGSGGASLYCAEMLRQIGLFDERFFAYFEDVDISFRAQLAGWQVRYQPTAVAPNITVLAATTRSKTSATSTLRTCRPDFTGPTCPSTGSWSVSCLAATFDVGSLWKICEET